VGNDSILHKRAASQANEMKNCKDYDAMRLTQFSAKSEVIPLSAEQTHHQFASVECGRRDVTHDRIPQGLFAHLNQGQEDNLQQPAMQPSTPVLIYSLLSPFPS
jgi:hypothetical protein